MPQMTAKWERLRLPAFLDELDRVWAECYRVLAPGGRIRCVCYVCVPRKRGGRHYVMPLHADIQVRARHRPGLFDCDPLAQDHKRRDRSQGQWRWLLRQAVSARSGRQKR